METILTKNVVQATYDFLQKHKICAYKAIESFQFVVHGRNEDCTLELFEGDRFIAVLCENKNTEMYKNFVGMDDRIDDFSIYKNDVIALYFSEDWPREHISLFVCPLSVFMRAFMNYSFYFDNQNATISFFVYQKKEEHLTQLHENKTLSKFDTFVLQYGKILSLFWGLEFVFCLGWILLNLIFGVTHGANIHTTDYDMCFIYIGYFLCIKFIVWIMVCCIVRLHIYKFKKEANVLEIQFEQWLSKIKKTGVCDTSTLCTTMTMLPANILQEISKYVDNIHVDWKSLCSIFLKNIDKLISKNSKE